MQKLVLVTAALALLLTLGNACMPCTTAFLLLFVVGRQALVWPGASAWWVLMVVGTIDVVVSRTLYYVLLRRLSVSLLSIVLTLSPVAAIGWSLLLFSAWPTPRELLGGVAVLIGVGIVTIARSVSGGG